MWGDNLIYRAIASDWTVSGIFSYHSGFPIVLTGSGCGGSSILNQCMPSAVAGQQARASGAYGKNTTAAPGSPNYIGNVQYLNSRAFTVATAGTSIEFRNLCEQPVDTVLRCWQRPGSVRSRQRAARCAYCSAVLLCGHVAVKRGFPIYHESWKVEIELDMSNMTNHMVCGVS